MPRPSNRNARRQQIMDALLEVMAEKGYEKATVGAISRQAKLTSGLIHYHFATKQDILLGLVDHLASNLLERFETRQAHAETPRDHLHAFIEAHTAIGRGSNPKAIACWVTIGAEALRQPEVQTVYQNAVRNQHKILLQLVLDILHDEQRDTAKAHHIASFILATIEGCYQLASAAPKTIKRGSAAQNIWDMTCAWLNTIPPKTSENTP